MRVSSIALTGTYSGAATEADSTRAPLAEDPLAHGLHLALHDHGHGEPVVLLHGSPGTAASWDRVRAALVRDLRAVAVDLIGFGHSSRCADLALLAPPAQARAVATALDEIDLRDATVVGHDLGASVALLLARARPDLVARLGIVAPEVPGRPDLLAGPLTGGRALADLAANLAVHGAGLDLRTDVGDRAQQRAIRRLARRPHVVDIGAGPPLDLPATIVWGTRDPAAPVAVAHRLRGVLPRSRTVLVEDAGHLLPREAPAEVVHAVRDLVVRDRGA